MKELQINSLFFVATTYSPCAIDVSFLINVIQLAAM